MTKHARLGGSNCDIWMNCTQAPLLWDKVGKKKPTSYMVEGTLAHSILEDRLKTIYFDAEPCGMYAIGTKHLVEGLSVEVTEDMLDAVDVAVEWVINNCDTEFGDKIWVEQKVEIPGLGEELFGTLDIAILKAGGKRLLCPDYKHGAGNVVDPIFNKQIMFYALGMLNILPKELKQKIEVIELVIIQPRAFGGGIASHVITIQQLQDFFADMRVAVAKIQDGSGTLNPGDHCKWCPAIASCPARADANNKEAGIVFADVQPKELETIQGLTFEQKVRIWTNKEIIEKWLDAIGVDLFDAAERGIEVPGFKLVAKKSNRRLAEDAEPTIVGRLTKALLKLTPSQGTKKDLEDIDAELKTQIYKAPKLIGIRDLEKYCKSVNVKIDDLIEKPDNGKTLAKATDVRAAKEPKAIAAFKDVKTYDNLEDI